MTSPTLNSSSRRQRDLDRRTDELRIRASVLLQTAPAENTDRAAEMIALVSAISEVLVTQPSGSAAADSLTGLAADLQELAFDLYRHQAAEQELRVGGFSKALRRLQLSTDSAVLVKDACDEVRRSCGFERVLLSRVDHSRCRPWRASSDARRQPWFTSWVDGDISLHDLSLEHVVAERHPDVIDTRQAGGHDMIRQSRSTSYAVAPIDPGGQVSGLFHADHGVGGRPCDETDRNILNAFTVVFSHVYERAFLLERLRFQQLRLRETLAAVDAEVGRLATLRPLNSDASLRAGLSRREDEVLDLLVRGMSNNAIAEALCISVRTAKAHVTSILIKLGAKNRSQVIAQLHSVPRISAD